MKAIQLKKLKNGEWFTLKPYENPRESQVYIRGEYDRTTRKYDVGKWSDISACRHMKGDRIVYIDFTF